MSVTTTRGIQIHVKTAYLPERSSPRESSYLFMYNIRISNVGSETAQLISREWIITNADGEVERVKGPGVVGEQPGLDPGDSYQYQSGCPLSTPSGIMVGRYTMRNRRGELFEVEIPAFSLDLPGKRRVN